MTNKQVKMEQQTEEPRVCQEPDVLKTLRPDPPESPPPNCAICLGTCTNKCFTDCCLHQFCFSCLLEWSKIKAECPLCKQPFKSIIYNIKSNLEYEEHIITNPERENQEDLLTLSDPSEYLFLPNGPRPQRHFQYRTTFTLEPGGEFAIQQLLLSHPRTNSISFPSDRYPYLRFNSSTHSVDQRRNIYVENWWVDPEADVTGRFRDCSPSFFRENPAQAHRIIPWLNRELTSLINHTLIYPVQQEILDLLCHYPIRSPQFRANILHHLGAQTDHFIHEFYNFVRSPYDMIGYDRHSTYTRHRVLPIYDLSDEDSDVHVVDSPENDDCVFVPNRTPEVIVIDSESSGNDSDVIMRTPTPPPIVDLVNDSSSDEDTVEVPTSQSQQEQQSSQQEHQESNVENDRTETRSPQLPIKIRLKRSKSSAEICNYYKHKEKRRLKRSHSSSSTSSDNSSSTESYNSTSKSSSDYYKYVKKKSKLSNRKHSSKNDSKYLSKNSKYRYKKVKKSKRSSSSKKSKKQKKSKRKENEKRHKSIKVEKSDSSLSSFSSTSSSEVANTTSDDDDDDNYHRRKKPKLFYEIKTEVSNSSHAPEPPQCSQSQTKQYEREETQETTVSTATSSPNSTTTSPSTVETVPSIHLTQPTSISPAVVAATAAATTFSTNNVETNSDHWSTTSIASSCPSQNVPQDLSVAGPSNGVTVQSMVVVKDKDGSLWCRGNYQPSKRYRLYRPDLNRSSDNTTDSD